MHVLMCVDVRQQQTPSLQQLDLCIHLSLNLRGTNAPGEYLFEEHARRWMEAARALVYKCGKILRMKYRLAVHQNHVAAHSKRWGSERHLDGLIGGRGSRHQRGAGQQSGPMQLYNSAVDTGSQSKVIGIEDEMSHGLSVSTRLRR